MDSGAPRKPRPPSAADDRTDVQPLEGFWDDSVGERVGGETAATTALTEYVLANGAKLGEYTIDEKIGQGAMGVVFSATHPMIGKRAAIKILKKELCKDPITLERFMDEARVVNQIGHPNIVDIFAFGEMLDGRLYFVMEWLKGETLRARIARGAVPLEATASIVRTLARALRAAHDKGVIHRDLKPDNVFLVDVGDEQPATVKLLDFGIAKLARNEHRIEKTATGAIVGTPQYIAPEQAKGYAIDHRADIYALGGIMFELLTGRTPFVADNAMEMVAKHLMEAPVGPSTVNPTVPPALDELTLRMLAKAPEARPTLQEVLQVLRLYTPGHESMAGEGRMSSFAEVSRPDAVPLVTPTAPTTSPGFTIPGSHAIIAAPRRSPKMVWIAGIVVVVIALVAFLIGKAVSKGSTAGGPAATPPSASPKPSARIESSPSAETPPAPKLETPAVVTPTPTPPTPTNVAPPPAVKRPPTARGKLELTVQNRRPRTVILVDGEPYNPKLALTVGIHQIEVRSPTLTKPVYASVTVRKGGVTRKTIVLPKR